MQGLCPEVPAPEIWAISGQTGMMAKRREGWRCDDFTRGDTEFLVNLLKILQIKFKWVKMPHLLHKFQ
jgi:hypothetical protein